MANMHTNSFIHNIGLNEENSLSHLLDQISPEIENETNLLEHSKYYNDVDFKRVLHNASSSKISMLSLNCQSINAKFDKLKMFLDDVNKCHPIAHTKNTYLEMSIVCHYMALMICQHLQMSSPRS